MDRLTPRRTVPEVGYVCTDLGRTKLIMRITLSCSVRISLFSEQ